MQATITKPEVKGPEENDDVTEVTTKKDVAVSPLAVSEINGSSNVITPPVVNVSTTATPTTEFKDEIKVVQPSSEAVTKVLPVDEKVSDATDNHTNKDSGPRAFQCLCSFYHDPLRQ